MKICLNGRITDKNPDFISGAGLFYGYGLFETIKITDKNPVFIKEHYRRLKKSSAFLKLKLDMTLPEFIENSRKLININKIREGALKLLFFKGAKQNHILINTDLKVYNPGKYKYGLSIKFSERIKNEKSLLSGHKTLNYLENILEKITVLKEGYDDVLFLNGRENITETACANIFFINKNKIYTPSLESGILPGIVREKILHIAKQKNIPLTEGFFSQDELMKADAVFLTNSLMGVMPVKSINGKKFKLDNEIFGNISSLYKRFLKI
ncbi:MAG: aminotransferase class IV [Endomicrobiaceae bacterium]|jgi:branched-subunit amino acid aminotransferase/4-amino-4-deoxychorismate lyase|nr:aminotransferase class IV [Endomicrobiaceae bacterium]MDD3730470.1 aminotransferase class IV [Endomicrobiaceae bacterium]MDD4166301.1 aminotransferase class IV [Endomicrobiaceae bacterium]